MLSDSLGLTQQIFETNFNKALMDGRSQYRVRDGTQASNTVVRSFNFEFVTKVEATGIINYEYMGIILKPNIGWPIRFQNIRYALSGGSVTLRITDKFDYKWDHTL